MPQPCPSKCIMDTPLSPPMERHQRIYHGRYRYQCEENCADLAYAIAKVKQAHGQAAEDYGEVEP